MSTNMPQYNNLIPDGQGLARNQELYFAIMEPNQPFEFAIVKKKYDYDNPPEYVTSEELGTCLCKQFTFFDFNGVAIKINLKPEDTVNLLPGRYYYTVKLKTNNTEDGSYSVKTIVDKTLFYVLE